MAPRPSMPADQLTFNVFLAAYDPGLNLKAMPAGQRLGFREIKRNKKLAHLKGDDYTVPSVQPNHHELSFHQTEFVGIWVGMRPSMARSYATTTQGEISTKGKCVNDVMTKQGYRIIDTDPRALRVVVPMHKKTASYYALTDQDTNGICSGLSIVMTDVFFFPGFRNDDLTETAKRKSEWSELVRKVSNPTEETDTKNALTPPLNNTALAKLAQSRTEMTEKECTAALSELLNVAPTLKELNISSRDLQRMSIGLVASGTILPYTHLRAFIVLFKLGLRNDSAEVDSEEYLKTAAVVATEITYHQLGGNLVFSEQHGPPDRADGVKGEDEEAMDEDGGDEESVDVAR